VRDHVVVGLIAATVTALLALPVRGLLLRAGAVRWRAGEGPATHPDDARVPTAGGLAMLGGLLVALAVAAPLPAFDELFTATSEPLGVLVGAILIAVLGLVDDLVDLSAALKLAGQLAVATLVASSGLQLQYFWVPGIGVLALSADLGLVLTVLFLVGFINVVNLVDGLDGLAAGVSGIGAFAFLLYALRGGGSAETLLSSATLVAVLTLGIAVGFLVHNWYPARMFMGDTGSMLLGLLLGAAGVAHVGRSSAPGAAEFAASVPLVVPIVVLAVPVVDTLLTIVRRIRRDQPVTRADLGHLHHLLVDAGHPHRRAVLLLYLWSSGAGLAVVGPLYLDVRLVVGLLLVVVLTATGFTMTGVVNAGVGRATAGAAAGRADVPGAHGPAPDAAATVSARSRRRGTTAHLGPDAAASDTPPSVAPDDGPMGT
jgi:UDP-GlcNAc:undecaprenyl-phosphate/decaprenyl-phosphate GlcNAc-1-phosphate transferase